MDTIHSFAMGWLWGALAVALVGAAIGSHTLVLAASVILVICAATLMVVNGLETWRERRFHSLVLASATFAERVLAAWSRAAKSLAPFGTAVTARCSKEGAAIAAGIRRLIDRRASR
jgi:hypothetical protein